MASEDLLKKAVAAFKALSPEQQTAMLEEQRQSWVRGNVGLSRDERGMTSPVMPRPAPAATDTGLVTVKTQFKIKMNAEAMWSLWLDKEPYVSPYSSGHEVATRELVTRSQAVELLAAKDETIRLLHQHINDWEPEAEKVRGLETNNAAQAARIKELEQINAMIMGDDENAPRYTTKRLKQEVERVTQVMRGEASDRQAHVEALEAKLATAKRRWSSTRTLQNGTMGISSLKTMGQSFALIRPQLRRIRATKPAPCWEGSRYEPEGCNSRNEKRHVRGWRRHVT